MIKMRSTIRWTHLLVLLFFGLGSQAQTIWYVNPNTVAPNPNGLSWSTGFERLDFALSAASSGDEIWVKAGTHIPMNTQGRSSTYNIPRDIALYGGFVGTESLRSQRDPIANLTTLSGDIGAVGNYSDNCYHVVTINGGTTNNIVDGFTIEAGFADGSAAVYDNMGGGLLALFGEPVVRNCTFQANKANYGGGAHFLTSGGRNPLVEETTFLENIAQTGAGLGFTAMGGGINEPMVRSCIFFDNYAVKHGGAMAFIGTGNNVSCDAQVHNCLVHNNTSDDVGGALYIRGMTTGAASPVFVNCTFADNYALKFAGAVSTYDDGPFRSKPIFRNSIFWGNSANQFNVAQTDNMHSGLILEDCILQGSNCNAECDGPTACSNTIFANPQFVNPSAFDFRLQAISPAVDAGVTANLPPTLVEDLDGNARVVGPDVDLGCYEYFTPCHSTPIAYVNHAATGNNDGTNWANAFNDLQDALSLAVNCSQISEIWVAEGTYHPGASRMDSYYLVDQVDVFGGFPNPITWPGNNPGMNDRNTDNYTTILSGDIGIAGDNSDNTYHIVIANNIGQGTEFDGFYVMFGNADNSQPNTPNVTRGYGGAIQSFCDNGRITGVTINDCRFIENRSDIFGGAISQRTQQTGEDYTILTNCLFEGNSSAPAANAGWGGAVGFLLYGKTDITIDNCEFHSNVSWAYGAAVEFHCLGSNPHVATVSSCRFEGNDISSNINRGVLDFQAGGTLDKLTVDKCSFRDNTTTALRVIGPNGTMPLVVNNSSFFNNSEFRPSFGVGGAPDAGGAMRLIYTKATVNHCSFVSNRAGFGGAILVSTWQTNSSELDLHNCIFWDNQATFQNYYNNTNGILNNGPASKVRIDHSMWQGSNCTDQALVGGTGRLTCGAGMIYGQNPNFFSLAGGNLRLNAFSPAINSGDAGNSLPDDIEGQYRPAGAGVEMGCYESLLYSKQATAESAETEPNAGFTCLPNPASDRVTVSLAQKNEGGTVQVLDLNGRVLLQQKVQGLESHLDLSNLSNGMYLIRYQSEGNRSTQRLVVSK